MMDNKNALIIFGSVASVILLVLYFTKQSGESGGNSPINFVYEVTGISPEVAAIRSQERIQANNNKKDITLGWLSFFLGEKSADTTRDISQIEATSKTEISRIESSAAEKIADSSAKSAQSIAQISANSAVSIAQAQGQTERDVARTNADAAKYVSKKQASGKTLEGIGKLISSPLSLVGKFFGLG